LLSILFAAFVVFAFDNASSSKAGCDGLSTEQNVCLTVNESAYITITDNVGIETTHTNVFASLRNLKLSFYAMGDTSTKNVRYRVSYYYNDEEHFSDYSEYFAVSTSTTNKTIDLISLFADENLGDKIKAFNQVSIHVSLTADWYFLYAVKGTYTLNATYKPMLESDISLYTDSDTSKYTYKVSHAETYGETVKPNSPITISMFRVLSSGSLTSIRSPYVVTMNEYQYLISLPKFDGTFLIRVQLSTVSGPVTTEREVTCDLSAPTVVINDVTAKVAKDEVKITSTGVSNKRVFNLTISDGDVYYKVVSASLPQPSTENLTTDWNTYTGKVAGALGDLVIGDGLNGKYYLYVIAKDKTDNYSNVARSTVFTLDNSAPTIDAVNVSLDAVNSEVIVSVVANDVSSVASYMARVAYTDATGTVQYLEWMEQTKYSFRLPIDQVSKGSAFYVEVYGVDGLNNFDETLVTRSNDVILESSSISVTYENVTSEHLREHGSVFNGVTYVRVNGSDVASIKVNGAEYVNNPQVCSVEIQAYRCKFAIDGEYSMVVKNSDGSEVIKRTFIINSHNAILVDSTRIEDYDKYFMASIRESRGKFIASVPNSAYDVENTLRFIYVASNGAYRHVMEDQSKFEIQFKHFDVASVGEYIDIEVPLTSAQYTALKYSAAFNTNYILCYTIEVEEVTTTPVVPDKEPEVVPPTDEPEEDTPVELPELDNPNQKPVTIKKENNSSISSTDMFKIFIAGAAVILFFKVINYRKSVKMI
jgi:hypothetical protein